MDKTFDEIDNLFLDYFNENKEVPYSIQNTINHALDSEKKQNSLLEFIKALIITLIGIFTVTGGLVFARKMVNNFFTVNTGLDTDNAKDILERNSGNVVDGYGNKDALKYAFTKAKGIDIDLPTREEKIIFYIAIMMIL